MQTGKTIGRETVAEVFFGRGKGGLPFRRTPSIVTCARITKTDAATRRSTTSAERSATACSSSKPTARPELSRAAGIKKGDIVAAATVTIPEMVYALYGLNKIGAAPLIIDPRTSAAGAMSFIKETGAKIFIVIDLYYEVLKDALFESGVEKIVVISADTSLPKSIRFLKQLKMPAPKIPTNDKVLAWTQFSATGVGVETETAEYGENDLAAVTLTRRNHRCTKGRNALERRLQCNRF